MIISPTKALDQGWITTKVEKEQVQQNGIDFKINQLFAPRDSIRCFVLNQFDEKEHIKYEELETVDGFWLLQPPGSYDFLSDISVAIPQGVAAFLYTRSTLIRNGLFITAGCYDSGYKGNVGGHLHTLQNMASIEKGSRIGQIIFMDAANHSLYNGQYNDWTAKKHTDFRENT